MTDRQVKGEIEDLLLAYVQCIDDGRLKEWPDFFTDECLYKVIPRDNYEKGFPASTIFCNSKGMLRDRITAYYHANIYEPHFYRHLINNVRISGRDGDAYLVETNYAVYQTMLDGNTTLYNVGKYVDKVVYEEGAPKFKEKVVVYDTMNIPTLMVTPI